jgi:hypothetical protein
VNCLSPYSKSVGSIRIRAPWARACSQWARASSTRTITEWVTSPWRGGRRSPRTSPTITAPSPNRSWARWFSPIRNSFGEAERRRQPGDGLGDVGVDQDGDDRGGRDGAVGFHTGRFNPCRELRDFGRRPPGRQTRFLGSRNSSVSGTSEGTSASPAAPATYRPTPSGSPSMIRHGAVPTEPVDAPAPGGRTDDRGRRDTDGTNVRLLA